MDVTCCCIAFVRLYFKFNSEFLRAPKIKNKHFYDIKTLRDELKLLASFFLHLFSHAVNICCPLSDLSRCRDDFKQLLALTAFLCSHLLSVNFFPLGDYFACFCFNTTSVNAPILLFSFVTLQSL